MTLVMGIDGGGSTIRVVVATPDLAILGQSEGPTVNPSVIGHARAAARIQAAAREALATADRSPGQIAAVCLGIAGASVGHSAGWLGEVIAPMFAESPQTRVVLSADYEIALVGAMGERRGVLILAGTGSLAYGVNAASQSALVGGWGYLLGDEGGGYWIGLEGLRAIIRADDGSTPPTALTPVLLDALHLPSARALIPWLYRSDTPRTREIAALAPLVLAQAQMNEPAAEHIVTQAARHLASMAHTVSDQLDMAAPDFAFTGGLLTTSNPLSMALCHALTLSAIPEPRYPPVIGAALLALTVLSEG
jgi:N-acetylglucosamine kinase-like BadF-type ATPase